MEQGFSFKTSLFGGFEKKAVLKFISEQIEQRTLAENESAKQIQELSQKAQAMESRAADYENRVTHLEETLIERDSRMNKAEALAQDLTAQVERLSAALREKDREVQIQAERNRQLQQKAEEMEQKAIKYDAISEEIGELMLEAKKNAAAVEKQARCSAEQIVGGARTGAIAYRNLFGAVCQEVQQMHAGMQQSQQQLEEQMAELEEQLRRMMQELGENLAALDEPSGPAQDTPDEEEPGDALQEPVVPPAQESNLFFR